MYQILLISFLVIAVALVAMILVQHGKGADMGASFGAGASNTVFGSSGSGNFLTRTTAILALLFFVTALALGYLTAHNQKLAIGGDIATQIANELSETTPEVPALETGIPSAEIIEVPATEAVAIPEAPADGTDDAVKAEAVKKEPINDPVKSEEQ